MSKGSVEESQIDVVVGGPATFLCELVAGALVEDGVRVHSRVGDSPERLRVVVRDVAATRTHQVVVLADPFGADWVREAAAIREADAKLGLIVLTARPSYLMQRTWARKLDDGRYLANGLLSLDATLEDLVEAVQAARRRPAGHSAFWLDGARHPAAFHRTGIGRDADKLRKKPTLHHTLVLEASGMSRTGAARRLGVKTPQVGERLSEIRSLLSVSNDVQLGRVATELGLFEDLDPNFDLKP